METIDSLIKEIIKTFKELGEVSLEGRRIKILLKSNIANALDDEFSNFFNEKSGFYSRVFLSEEDRFNGNISYELKIEPYESFTPKEKEEYYRKVLHSIPHAIENMKKKKSH